MSTMTSTIPRLISQTFIKQKTSPILSSAAGNNITSYFRRNDNGYGNTKFHLQQHQHRLFSKRKGAAMGHHIEKLNEMAHREERQRKEEKKNRKLKKSGEKKNKHKHVETKEDVRDEEEEEEEEEEGTTLPDVDKIREKMLQVVSKMEESFRQIRGAEPTPELFESIPVNAYGAFTPLNTVGQVVISSPSLVTVSCFDPSLATEVSNAIRDAGMNFNPSVEDGTVFVPVPKVSQETRVLIVKKLKSNAEKYRIKVRNIRRRHHDFVKKVKDGKVEGISKDDAFRFSKEIDVVTEEVIQALDQKEKEKEQSIMAV